jgi:hypothetical protein
MRVGRSHLFRNRLHIFDLNQFALTHAWAPGASAVPFAGTREEFRPPRKSAALNGFYRVNAASLFIEERTLRMPRDSQAPQFPGSVNMPRFELRQFQTEKLRQANDVPFRKVNEPLFFAAFFAARLALEAHPAHDQAAAGGGTLKWNVSPR